MPTPSLDPGPVVDGAPGIRERRFGRGTSLRAVAARGTILNGAFLIAVTLLGMSRGIVMAGFLSREEYGVWGILLTMYGTLALLRQIGIGDRFVQQDEEDQVAEFQRAFTLELALAALFGLLGALFVLGAAALYGLPELVVPGLVMLLGLPLAALQLPIAIHYRRMDFKRQRTLQAAEPLVGFVVTIGCAIGGMGYWALVVGGLAGALAGALVAVAFCPYPLRLRRPTLVWRAYAEFSWPIMLGGVATLVLAQGLIGFGNAALGLAGVGVIAFTSQIAQLAARADQAISDTIYPAICAMKDRRDVLFESFVKSNRLALMWGIPFAVGVSLFSEDLLSRLFDGRWESGAGLLTCTVLAIGANQLGFNWQAYYRALGQTRPFAVEALVSLVSYGVVVFPLLALDGLRGLGIGILVSQAMVIPVRWVYLRRLFPQLRILRHMARAIVPVVPGAVVVLLARLLETGEETLAEFLLLGGTFAVLTLAMTLLLERRLLREMRGYFGGPQGIVAL